MVLKLTNKKDGLKRLELLKKLQLIDNHLGGLEKRKKVLLGDLEGKQAHVQEKQNFLTEKQKEHKKFQKEIDNKELDLKCKEEEIKKFRLDLYKIKNNKEYTALLSEIGGREADKSLLEDEILAMMSQIEDMAAGQKNLAREVEEEEKALKALANVVEEELKGLDKDIQEARRQLEENSQLVDKESLEQYKRLIEKDGLAVVEVSGESCGGCFMGITPQTINLLMRCQDLILCKNCGRILYLLEEGPEAGEVAARPEGREESPSSIGQGGG